MPKFDDVHFCSVAQLLYFHLSNLGDYYPLKLWADPGQVREQLARFDGDWRTYNPHKPGYKRQGLSVTSFDGTLDHGDDLTSLTESNRLRGTDYNEMSFRTPTPVLEHCPAVRALLEPFLPYLGRTHFLKFDTGGFFPWHRDSFAPGGTTFRIFVPFTSTNSRDFIFLLGDKRLQFDTGRAYFINTRIEHTVFSMEPNSLHLVLNVELSHGSVEAVCQNTFSD